MEGMCQNNYVMLSNEQKSFQDPAACQPIEPIIYMKDDECQGPEEPANSGASYVELRSLIEVPVSAVSSSADSAKRHENMPQL